jgi:hypothetical protein
LRAVLRQAVQASPDDAATKELIYKTINRHARGFGDPFRGFVWDEGLPSAILEKSRVQDNDS